eukprot:363565-Chlamydomonas_euryale.AAC.3
MPLFVWSTYMVDTRGWNWFAPHKNSVVVPVDDEGRPDEESGGAAAGKCGKCGNWGRCGKCGKCVASGSNRPGSSARPACDTGVHLPASWGMGDAPACQLGRKRRQAP